MAFIDLAERVAVVTGASRGIGLETAKLLLDAGCSVVLNCRKDTPDTKDVFAELEAAYPGKTSAVYGSIGDAATTSEIGRHVQTRYKRLDILVNNAGILRERLIGMIPDAEIEEVFEVNVFGLLRMIQLAARLMSRRKSGSIVNLSSVMAKRGNVGQMVYALFEGCGYWRNTFCGQRASHLQIFASMQLRQALSIQQ